MALVVVTPALEPVEATAATPAQPVQPEPVRKIEPARVRTPALDPDSAFSARATVAQRASRAAIRRAAGVRPAVTPLSRRPSSITRHHEQAATHRTQSDRAVAAHRSVRVRQAVRAARRTIVRTRTLTRQTASPSGERVMRLGDMTAVIAYAKSQLGSRYVSGGEGRGGFDCSGLTKQAYAKAGIRLPHSSGAQAARAHRISRSQARAGDLVVGSGHVGIYMGHGMMIDAGNHRTGVVYRKLYSGLSVERL